LKFDLEIHDALRIHAYASGAITLAVPANLEVEPEVDPETGLCQVRQSLILTAQHLITDWEPSRADERITRRLKSALELVDIRLLDHLIIGDGRATSMASRGLL